MDVDDPFKRLDGRASQVRVRLLDANLGRERFGAYQRRARGMNKSIALRLPSSATQVSPTEGRTGHKVPLLGGGSCVNLALAGISIDRFVSGHGFGRAALNQQYLGLQPLKTALQGLKPQPYLR